MIDTPEGIEFVRLVARRGALSLEVKGFRRRGRSAYSICKEVYGLRGSKEKVLKQMNQLIESAQIKRANERIKHG